MAMRRPSRSTSTLQHNGFGALSNATKVRLRSIEFSTSGTRYSNDLMLCNGTSGDEIVEIHAPPLKYRRAYDLTVKYL